MAVNVATLTAKLQADTRDFDRGMKSARRELEHTEKSTRLLDRQIGNTGITMRQGLVAGAAVAGAAVVKFAGDAIKASSDLNESMNAVNVVFGDAAAGIHEIGKTSAESFGMSQRSFNEFATRFSAFANNIAEGSGKQVVDVVGEMTQRVADFASVHNLSLEEAAQVASSTLAGETEVFRRFGGDVSAAAVQQKALEMGLGGVNGELTEGQKQLVRYRLFMEQTDNTAGDFENTSGDLANAVRILNARFENLKARLGDELVPVAQEATNAGINLLDAFDSDVNLGWSQRLSAAFQTLLGESAQSVQAYIDQKVAVNESGNAMAASADQVLKLKRNMAQGEEQTKSSTRATKDYTLTLRDARLAQLAFVDPALAAIHALDNYKTSLKASEDATRKYGETSDEARDAGIDLLESYSNLIAEAKNYADVSGIGVYQAIHKLGSEAGLTDSQIQFIIASLKELDGLSVKPRIQIQLEGGGVLIKGGTGADVIHRQGGGFVNAGQPFIGGEAGGELFVPTQSGSVVPANSISLTQNFQRVDGNNIEADIARGLILSGIGRYIETGF